MNPMQSTVFPTRWLGAAALLMTACSDADGSSVARDTDALDPTLLPPASESSATPAFFDKAVDRPSEGLWEFDDPRDADDFVSIDPRRGSPGSGWSLEDGYYTQTLNPRASLLVTRNHFLPSGGCVETIMEVPDDDWSGVVFAYVDADHFYFYEASASARMAAIRYFANGSVITLASTTWSGDWGPRARMIACYLGSDIGAWIEHDPQSHLLVSSDYVQSGGHFGLWNRRNSGTRHDALYGLSIRDYSASERPL